MKLYAAFRYTSYAFLVVLVHLFITGCGIAPSVHIEKPGHDEPIEAAMFRYQQRLSENGKIPDNAFMRAKSQRDALLNRAGLGAGVSSASWDWIGPGNIGGRIRPIIFHPKDANIIWVGSASGGIWKTTDGGQDWQPLDDFMPSLSIGCMVMDPANPDVLYVGTGEGFFETEEGSSNTAAVRGAGIFKTTNGGTTWDQMPSTANSDFYFVNRLVIHPQDSNVMIAACGSGIWRTTDGGDTWTQQAIFNALDVKMNPSDSTKLVAGGHHTEDGPYYSTDSGLTWNLATGAGGHRQELAYAPSDPNIVYASVSLDGDKLKVWRSNDGGQTYSLMTTGDGVGTWASYNNTLWVHPTNEDFIIVGGVRLFRSTDAGVNLVRAFNSVHADMHGIVQHPEFDGTNNKKVFFATDGGIWTANDINSNSVFNLNNNLGITQFYGAGINPTTGHVMGGTQDNGTLSYMGDKQGWTRAFGGDGGFSAADPTDPLYFYGEVQRARIHRSTNGGSSSNYIYNGIGDAGGLESNFIPYFILDPNDPNTMLVACRRMWRSSNVKDNVPTWTSIKPEIDDPNPRRPRRLSESDAHFAPNDPRNLSTISVAQGNSDLILAGHNNGQIWITTNGTADTPNWTRIDENGGNVLPDRWVSRIAINPNNHDEIYISFMGWESDNIWKTEDAGLTWQNISGTGNNSIPSAPASALAIHQLIDGRIYVGTDIGVFTSTDDGRTWTTSTEGPGTVPVEELIWKNNTTLMAVTHGRGVYIARLGTSATLSQVTMIEGELLEGGPAELEESDDIYVRTRSGFGETLTDLHNMEIAILAESQVDAPQLINITIESYIDQPSGTVQVRVKNFNTLEFDMVHSYAIGTTEAVEEIFALDASTYLNPNNGRIRVRIKHIVFVPFLAFTFESFIDQAEIRVE